MRSVPFIDENSGASSKDALHVPIRLIISARSKRFEDALTRLIHKIRADSIMLHIKMGPKQDLGLDNVIKATDWACGSKSKDFQSVNFNMLFDLGMRKANKFANFNMLLPIKDSPINDKLLPCFEDNKLPFTFLIVCKGLTFLILFENLLRQLISIYFLDCKGLTFQIFIPY